MKKQRNEKKQDSTRHRKRESERERKRTRLLKYVTKVRMHATKTCVSKVRTEVI